MGAEPAFPGAGISGLARAMRADRTGPGLITSMDGKGRDADSVRLRSGLAVFSGRAVGGGFRRRAWAGTGDVRRRSEDP